MGHGRRSPGGRRPEAAILGVAIAVRVAYVLATPGYTPTHDDRAYNVLAAGIARTGAYPLLTQGPTAYRPPAFPYLLGGLYALVGAGHQRIVAGRLLEAVVGTVAVGLIGALAWRLFGRATARAAMVLAALYPPLVAAGTSLLSEPLAIVAELGAVLLVLAWRRRPAWPAAVGAGALAGVMTLTRSNAFVIIPALALGMWTARPASAADSDGRGASRDGRREAPRRPGAGPAMVAMVVTALVVVAPWTVRNAVVLHSFVPVSDEAGGTLAGTYNPVSDHGPPAPAFWHLVREIPSYQKAVAPLAGGPEVRFQSRLLHLAEQYAEHHPAYVAKVAWYNTLRLVGIGRLSLARYNASVAGITSPAVADAGIVSFWVLALLAAGAVAWAPLRRRVPGFLWVLMVLLYVSVVMVNAEAPRLRLPLDPFVLVLAAAGLVAAGNALLARWPGPTDRRSRTSTTASPM